MTTVIEGCAVATVDAAGTEHADGHVVVEGSRITAVGPGPADPSVVADADTVVDARGCLVTPGLVNTHHHLYQWATRGLAQQDDLFEWLTTLYPVWARIDEDVVGAAAAAGLGWLARSGCTTHAPTTTTCSRATAATCSARRSRPPARSACASTRPAARWTSGSPQGGLPPDSVVETIDAILAGTRRASTRYHDPSPGRDGAGRASRRARRSRSPTS